VTAVFDVQSSLTVQRTRRSRKKKEMGTRARERMVGSSFSEAKKPALVSSYL
jgi:hypothetical protein